ncbi:MAG: CoA transferase, partial [Novosphingobium sp.]
RRRWSEHPWLANIEGTPNAPAIVSVFPTGADLPELWPWSTHPALAAAASGLMAITGWEDGPPVQPEVPLADYCAGALAALRVAAALWRGSARGLVVEEPMHRSLMRMIEWQCPAASVLGQPALRQGNSLALDMGMGSLCRSSDGKYISVSAVGDKIVERLLRLIGGDTLLQDPRFETIRARTDHVRVVYEIMLDWALLHTADEIMQFAVDHDIVMGIVHDARGIEDDPQVQARGNLMKVGEGEDRFTLVAPMPRLTDWIRPMRPERREDIASLSRFLADPPVAAPHSWQE